MCRRECLSGEQCEHTRYCKSSAAKAQAHYREWKARNGETDGKRISRTVVRG